jgi:hypothetical protein
MKKTYMLILALLAIISFVVAIIYFTNTAGNLPHFFLGYSAGSSHKHTKHAIAFTALGIVLLVAAWMMGGPKKADTPNTSSDTDA